MAKLDVRLIISPKLKNLLNDLSRLDELTRRDMARVAAMVQTIILRRTATGKYLNTDYHADYSTQYKRRRFKEKGYSNPAVTLYYTGEMLQGIRTEVTMKKGLPAATIGYPEDMNETREYRLASYHQTLGAGKNKVKREFIGLSASEEKRVREYLKRLIVRNLPK